MKVVEIIGAGVVGYATGLAFRAKGIKIKFVETDKNKLKQLKSSEFDAAPPESAGSENVSVHFICVPTPTVNNKIYLKYLISSTKSLAARMRRLDRYSTVVVKSTVVPGTTENVVLPILESVSGKKVKKDFGLCMNPEYLRSNSAIKDALEPWVIVIGEADKRSGDSVMEVYNKFNCPKYRLSITEAELQKYIHNAFNANKIAFFNEMRIICRKLNISDERLLFETVTKSAESFWNSKYGLKNLGPFTGKCLPKDTVAFATWARQTGMKTIMISSILKQNTSVKTEN